MDNIVQTENLTKIYPGGVVANYRVDFSVRGGEIHALVGENGAGKSTLMKILFGMERPTDGRLFLFGHQVKLKSSLAAIKHGIGMVHQHFMLVDSLTVAENLTLGAEPKNAAGFVDKKKSLQICRQLAQKYDLSINPTARVRDISVAMRQKLEILKALYRGARILILDEPTAVLTPQECRELFAQLKNLQKEGHTIIFISHKLREVKELCDRLTVMRDGQIIGCGSVDDFSEREISRMMVGRDVDLKVNKNKINPGAPRLTVKNLSYTNELGEKQLDDISFTVRSGQIVGIAGIEGNGQNELISLLTGMLPTQSGRIIIGEQQINDKSVRQIRALGLAHIPEDRIKTGVAVTMNIADNLISERYYLPGYQKKGLLNQSLIKKVSKKLIADYRIKTTNEKQMTGNLSGGNIQKVVVGREFSSDAAILVINQPTRGIDVGAIEFIRQKIIDMRDLDKAILLSSADLSEVLTLSDSLLVFYNGKIAAYFARPELISEEEVGLYMLGVKRQNENEILEAVR